MPEPKPGALPLGDAPTLDAFRLDRSERVNQAESMVRRLSLIFVLSLLACHAERPDPEEVLRTFLADLRNGRAEAAWRALCEESQSVPGPLDASSGSYAGANDSQP